MRITTELARQIADHTGTAERHAQQQLGLIPVAAELTHFIGVIGHEHFDTSGQGIADVDITLDRMRMDAARRIGSELMSQLHFTGRGQIQPTTQRQNAAHNGRMRQGLECVMQINARQGLGQLAVLSARALAINDQQGRTVLLDQTLYMGGLKRIDVRLCHGNKRLSPSGPAARQVLIQAVKSEGAAALRKRSRTASQVSSSGTRLTSNWAQPD